MQYGQNLTAGLGLPLPDLTMYCGSKLKGNIIISFTNLVYGFISIDVWRMLFWLMTNLPHLVSCTALCVFSSSTLWSIILFLVGGEDKHDVDYKGT